MTVLENLVAPLPDAKWSTMLKPSVAGHEADRARELLAFVGMEKFAGRPAGALSYGQQKLVELAQVLMLELCDPVVVFSRGRAIAEGPPQTIREDPVVLDAYLGDEWRPPAVTGETAAPGQPQEVR